MNHKKGKINFTDMLSNIQESINNNIEYNLDENDLNLEIDNTNTNTNNNIIEDIIINNDRDINISNLLIKHNTDNVITNELENLEEIASSKLEEYDNKDTNFILTDWDSETSEILDKIFSLQMNIRTAEELDSIDKNDKIIALIQCYETLYNLVLDILSSNNISIPISTIRINENDIQTNYIKFEDREKYSIKQLIAGLITLKLYYSNNTRFITETKNKLDIYQNILSDKEKSLKIFQEVNTELNNKLAILEDRLNSIKIYDVIYMNDADKRYILYKVKNDIPEYLDENNSNTTSFIKALKFSSFKDALEYKNNLVKDRKKIKAKGKKWIKISNPHKLNIAELSLVRC